jgi:hypothetical protein
MAEAVKVGNANPSATIAERSSNAAVRQVAVIVEP